ncbi:hypothetical protein HYW20_03035 [Candidatus Woesearchaeota archaeon]|nr:hypothetical protein [Candidatus Woesearchaeota archaeon]
MKIKYSKIGYTSKIIGGSLVTWALLSHSGKLLMRVLESDMPKILDKDPLQVASYALTGVTAYFIGDRMHRRELEEHRTSLLEEKLNEFMQSYRSREFPRKIDAR